VHRLQWCALRGLEDTGMTVMRTVEVVVTVRVPEDTDVAAVAGTVAGWSAPLDAGVGWRVLSVEGIEEGEG
jgi:hypothetical protein